MLNLQNLNLSFGLAKIQEEYLFACKKNVKPWGEVQAFNSGSSANQEWLEDYQTPCPKTYYYAGWRSKEEEVILLLWG